MVRVVVPALELSTRSSGCVCYLDVVAQVEMAAKFESGSSYYSFKR